MMRSAGGYTIIEVLVVLAVTGALFVSAAILFNGKQGRTEFSQSMRDFESKLQTVANEVSTGFYVTGFTCKANGSGQVKVTSPVASEGANEGCIFLGKAVHSDGDQLDTYTVVGKQYIGSSTDDVVTIDDAKPVAVSQYSSGNSPDVTNTYQNKWGMKVTAIKEADSNNPIGTFAFISELGGGVGASSPVTGSRGVVLYSIKNSRMTDSPNSVVGDIERPTLYKVEQEGVKICVTGANRQIGEIDLGTHDSQTGTEVLIDEAVSDACKP